MLSSENEIKKKKTAGPNGKKCNMNGPLMDHIRIYDFGAYPKLDMGTRINCVI